MKCVKIFSVATKRENNELNTMEDCCLLKMQDRIQIPFVLQSVGKDGRGKAEEVRDRNHHMTNRTVEPSQGPFLTCDPGLQTLNPGTISLFPTLSGIWAT